MCQIVSGVVVFFYSLLLKAIHVYGVKTTIITGIGNPERAVQVPGFEINSGKLQIHVYAT